MTDSFAAVDLSLIGAALGLELTPDLSMDRMQSAVQNTLAGMTKAERATIPELVWGMMDGMFPSAKLLNHCQIAPKSGAENGSAAFSVQKDGQTVVVLPNRQTPGVLMAGLEAKPRFAHWKAMHKPSILVSSTTIRLTCQALAGLDAAFIKKIIESW